MTDPLILSGHQSEVFDVAWSPDGELLASASRDRTVRLWQMPHGHHLTTIGAHRGAVHAVAFAPGDDDPVIASTGADAVVQLWSATGDPLHTLTGHGGPVRTLAWSPDGSRLVSAGTFWTFSEVKLWQFPGADELATLRTGKGELAFAVALDGEYVIAGLAPGLVASWQLNDQAAVAAAILRCHGEAVRAVAFAPSGDYWVTGSSDNTLKRWSRRDVLRESEPELVYKGHTGAVRAVAVSPDDSRIASGAGDGLLKIWRATDGQVLTDYPHGGAVHGVAWSPAGDYVATASADGLVYVWPASV